jgi:hypothetical protein
MRVRVIKDIPTRYSKGAELTVWPGLGKRLIDQGIAVAMVSAEAMPEEPAPKKKKAPKKKG